MRGTFVALEGVDGVGKTTQVDLLRAQLESCGRTVLTVREPGGTDLGESIRELLLRREDILIGAEAQMLLFLASRVELWEQRIAPAIESGSVVLSDRFHLSTVVYQGAAGTLGEERAIEICHAVLGDRRPDLNIILELPVDRTRKRIGADPDRFERPAGFLESVAEGFAETRGLPGDRIARVSAEGTPEAVAARVREEVVRAVPDIERS